MMFESGENNPDIRVPVVRNSSGSYDFFICHRHRCVSVVASPKSEFESEGGMLQIEELEHG